MAKRVFLLAMTIGWLGASNAGADLAEIKKAGVLRVLTVVDNTGLPGPSPFLAVDGDKVSGFDADVLTAFARTHQLRLETTVVSSWERLIPDLAKGQADVAAGNVTASELRLKQVDFTVETLPTRALLVSYPPFGRVENIEQIGAEKVAVIKGTSTFEVLVAAGVPTGSIDGSLSSPQGVLEALRSGRHRVAIMELLAAYDAQRRDPKIQLGGYLGPTASLGYAVRKDCPRLLEALNAHITALKRSPSWYQLLVNHFGPAIPDVLARLRRERE